MKNSTQLRFHQQSPPHLRRTRMQQNPFIPAQPHSHQQTYPLLLRTPKTLKPSQWSNRDLRAGLSEAVGAQVPLWQAVSQPLLARQNHPDLTVSCETVNISICSTPSSDVKTLQGSTMTAEDDSVASIIVKPSITSLKSIISLPSTTSSPSVVPSDLSPPLPFPSRSFNIYRPERLVFERQLLFSHFPPSLFSNKTWKMMWLRRQELDLDSLTITTALPPSKSQPWCSTAFQYKTEFTGYAYRVVINPGKCHAGICIQCGSIVNIANLNTDEGKYVVDVCQLVRDEYAFFPVHYWIGDGQGFTSADDFRHYSFILIVPSTYCLVNESPLLHFLSKLKPTCSSHIALMFKLFLSCLCHSFTSKAPQQDHEKTLRPLLDLEFLPLPSPQSQQHPDDFLDITDDEPFADARRRYDFWYCKYWCQLLHFFLSFYLTLLPISPHSFYVWDSIVAGCAYFFLHCTSMLFPRRLNKYIFGYSKIRPKILKKKYICKIPTEAEGVDKQMSNNHLLDLEIIMWSSRYFFLWHFGDTESLPCPHKNYHRMPQQSASTYIHDDYFILSPNFILKPSKHRQSVLTTAHDPNSNRDSQSVCSLRTTQSERTVDTNASNPAEDLTTMGYMFWPIFPPIFYNETTHLKMNPTQRWWVPHQSSRVFSQLAYVSRVYE